MAKKAMTKGNPFAKKGSMAPKMGKPKGPGMMPAAFGKSKSKGKGKAC